MYHPMFLSRKVDILSLLTCLKLQLFQTQFVVELLNSRKSGI